MWQWPAHKQGQGERRPDKSLSINLIKIQTAVKLETDCTLCDADRSSSVAKGIPRRSIRYILLPLHALRIIYMNNISNTPVHTQKLQSITSRGSFH